MHGGETRNLEGELVLRGADDELSESLLNMRRWEDFGVRTTSRQSDMGIKLEQGAGRELQT